MPEPVVVEPIKKVAEAASQAARAESAPPHVRRYRAYVFRFGLIAIAGAFAVLTFLVKTMPTFALDLQIAKVVQAFKYPPYAAFMSMVSWPGFNPQSEIIAALIIVLIFIFGLRWEAVMSLGAAVFSTGIDVLVKDLIQRPRPSSGLVNVFANVNGYSFPSGHVMFYVGFLGFIWFLVFTLLKPSIKRTLLLVFFGSLVALIGVSRVYLGEHWPSDVLGSYLLGSLALVAIIQIYLWGKTRFFVHEPAAAEPQKA